MVATLAPRFDSSSVHFRLPIFRLDLVFPYSRFLVVRFTENDSKGGGVGFFWDLML